MHIKNNTHFTGGEFGYQIKHTSGTSQCFVFVCQDQVKQAKLQISKPKHVCQGSHLHVFNFPVDLLLQHRCVCMCVLGCSVARGGAEVGRRSQWGLPQPGAHSVHREDSQHYDEE